MSSPCAVCGGTELAPHLTVTPAADATLAATTTAYGAAPGNIVRCRLCGHMQVKLLPAQELLIEEYSNVWDEAYVEEEAGQRATARRALERIERHAGPGAICDLGCWVGFLLAEAEGHGWRAVGVEPSEHAATYARERLGLDVRTAPLEQAGLPEHAFDAVVMADVIEHLPDPGAALDRARGLLRQDGVVYLALPDAGSRTARILGSRWWSVLPTHVHYFTRASLGRILARHGFALEWAGTAPKAFSVAYYVGRLEGYSPGLARAGVRAVGALGLAERLVWPDFRDRMAVVARVRSR